MLTKQEKGSFHAKHLAPGTLDRFKAALDALRTEGEISKEARVVAAAALVAADALVDMIHGGLTTWTQRS